MKISYYENSISLRKIYEEFFNSNKISFVKKRICDKYQYSYLEDYSPIEIETENDSEFKRFLLDAIDSIDEKAISFVTLLDNEIYMSHLIHPDDVLHNYDYYILISIEKPVIIENIRIPDFTYYAKRLLPSFHVDEIKSLDFSYF